MSTTATTGFSINMGLGVLELTFAEPVIAASIRFGELMFLDAANGATTSSLTGGAVTSAPFSTVVSVTLRDQDLDNLKRRSLCTTPAACYLSFGASTITDTSNLFVVARGPDNPVPVAQHFADLIKPSITGSGFRLFDLNAGQIVLSFNEAVRVSAIDVLELTLQNFYDSPDTSYRLTGGTVLTASDGPEITIQLSNTDLDAVKTDRLLCVSKSTCYVMLSAAFLTDIAGNTLNPTTSANANDVSKRKPRCTALHL